MTGQLGPDELVTDLTEMVADYRRDEGFGLTAEDVACWIDQFAPSLRMEVLRETHSIMQKRYFSRRDTEKLLEKFVVGDATRLAGGDLKRFLAETAFLNLQPAGKSQGALLEILGGLSAGHGFALSDCGGNAPKRYVYFDDILCSGNTFFQDMRRWWLTPGNDGRPRQQSLPSDVTVYYRFLALHRKNWFKTRARFGYDKELHGRVKITTNNNGRAGIVIENDREAGSKLDFAFPRRAGLSPAAERYVQDLGARPEETYRHDGMPTQEQLFTSANGRDQFERAVVDAGLAIIDSVQNHNPNFHPLGYQIPSHKSLGFGALAFTWRNVPNNSPLAFWHDAVNWKPLFRKRQAALDFGFVDER